MATAMRRRVETAEAVITTARHGRSTDLANREIRYALTMATRVACFVGAFFVGGWVRWALLVGAAVLPGIAVLLANAIDKRGQITPVVTPGPDPHHAVTAHASPHAGATVLEHDD